MSWNIDRLLNCVTCRAPATGGKSCRPAAVGRRPLMRRAGLSHAAGLVLALFLAAPAPAAAVQCESAGANRPMAVTADCDDPIFNAANFVIDDVTEIETPPAHTKLTAHFRATDVTPRYDVTFYLPPADKWQGRFFQHVYPLEQPENLDDIAFALANGGYLVNVKGVPCGCGGYRPDAAAAKLAKDYASRFYGKAGKIFGYVWGGSGGSLQTIGAVENTTGVWDGAIPYVMATEASMVNAISIGAMTGLALREKLPAISAALKPGASGDPFERLTADERMIFEEALRLGVPLQSFEDAYYSGGILMFLSGGVRANDPTYLDDFWSAPGYEGANPPEYLSNAKVDHLATVTQVKKGAGGAPTALVLDGAPELGTIGALGLEFWLYAPDGVSKLGTLDGELSGAAVTLKGAADPDLLDRIKEGAKLRVNNLFFLSLHFYHRHAIPQGPGHYAYDQFRNPDGSAKHPQRSYLASREQAVSTAGGGTQNGKINTKVVVLQSMLDGGAQPWMADWYARQVRAALGGKAYKDNFRLWYNDNAGHLDSPPRGGAVAHMINYVPSLYQSLRDLVTWVEEGKAPPESTHYVVVDGQVRLPSTAAKRRGIQPVVTLTVAGSDQIETTVNQPVEFSGRIETPPGAGVVVGAGWWFGDGAPAYNVAPVDNPAPVVEIATTHSYDRPGVYYVTLFAASHPSDSWATRSKHGSGLACGLRWRPASFSGSWRAISWDPMWRG